MPVFDDASEWPEEEPGCPEEDLNWKTADSNARGSIEGNPTVHEPAAEVCSLSDCVFHKPLCAALALANLLREARSTEQKISELMLLNSNYSTLVDL